MKLSEVAISRKEDLVEFFEANEDAIDAAGIILEGDKVVDYKQAVTAFLEKSTKEGSNDEPKVDDQGTDNPNNKQPLDSATESQPIDVSTDPISTPKIIDEVEEQARAAKEVAKAVNAASEEEKAKELAKQREAKKESEVKEEIVKPVNQNPTTEPTQQKEYSEMDTGELLVALGNLGFDNKKDILDKIYQLKNITDALADKERELVIREQSIVKAEQELTSRSSNFQEQADKLSTEKEAVKQKYKEIDEKTKKLKEFLSSF